MRVRFLNPVAVAVAVIAAATANAFAQAPAPVVHMAAEAHPSLAVATIKPHDPNSRRQGISVAGDRLNIRNQSVTSLMIFAYAIDKHQIANAPGWVADDTYDIEGTTDTPGEPGLHQMQEMVQKLLADRFQLKLHREKRDLSVYALRVVKGGPKLKPAANPDAEPDQSGNSQGTEQTINYTSASMPDFILGEQFFMDRPIVDQTRLTGRYDFSIRYTFDEAKATDPNAPPGIFTAVQEQLGLKFEPTKAPADVFVIDHVEQPSAN